MSKQETSRLPETNQAAASAKDTVDVFVSYCRKDKLWKDWLVGGRLSGGSAKIVFWTDDDIEPSEDWAKEIRNSLETAKVAVLLVSQSFLKSKFIREIELPTLLKQREAKKAKILWVPLEPDMPDLQKTGLFGIQAVWSIDSPLVDQPEDVRSAVLDRIDDYILRELDPPRWRIGEVCRKLSNKYEVLGRMGEGTFRTVYQGRDHALERYVSIVALKRIEELSDFQSSLLQASRVEDLDVFITVYEAVLSTNPPFYVRQYIAGQTLYERLEHGRLPFSLARDVLVRIGKAVDAAHRRDFFHLNIKPSNILVDQQDRVFLSTLSRRPHYYSWLKENWGSSGADHPSKEDYAYAIPEFFRGRVVPRSDFDKCDQYLLGLLGYHMITGDLPTRASEEKVPRSRSDFGDLTPIQARDGCQLCPQALADSIMRMVSREPSERFDSVAVALRELAQFGEESLTLAKESYRRVASVNNWESKVFEQFYREFRSQCQSEKALEMFKKMNWQQQYEMLKEAVLLLLVFCEFEPPEPKDPTVLSRIATKHSRLELRRSDLDLFQAQLIAAFVSNDPGCENNRELSAELTQAWRKSLQRGVDFMKQHVPL
jgi:serine/threonine protein kinase